MPITQTSVKRPIATSMTFLIILTLGVIGFRFLPVDLLPPIEYPQLTIATDYSNVAPEEMETIITQRVENSIAGVPNVERVRSNSVEGRSWVTLEFAQGTNLDAASNDVRGALDRIRDNLPPEVEAPRIWKFDPNNFPVVIVGARSNMDLQKLTRILDREVTKRFEQVPGVGSIDVWGGVYREVHINLKRDRLYAAELTAEQVRQAIAGENANLPGGNVQVGIQSLNVRTLGEYQSVDQIANTVIKVVDGDPIKVKDVAEVVDGYEDLGRLVHIDDKPVVRFGIRKQSGANTVAVAERIRSEVEQVNKERTDMDLMITTDQSDFIQDSINNVQRSTIWGGLLAIFVLYIFLRNGSSTFIVAISIPISIVATFGLLYFSNLTLNQMSFGGLALGVGMIVDNAIVVLENIVRLRENGKSLRESSLTGTKQVGGAIVASTLTTSVIFLPVVFMQTISGLLFQELALVVVFALVCSLLVALTLVPMLASRFLTIRPDNGQEGAVKKKSRFQQQFEKLEYRYAGLVRKTLTRKKWLFGTVAVLLGGVVLLIPRVPVELAPQTDADEIDIDLMMAEGTNIAVQNEYLKELDELVRSAISMDDVEFYTTDVRDGRAEVELAMVDAGERSMSTSRLADSIRANVAGRIPGADIRVSAQSGLWILRRVFGSGGDEAVQVELRGHNLDTADELAQQIKQRMEGVQGVEGVRVGRREGQPQQNIIYNRDKISDLGLTVGQVSRIVQTSVGGRRAGTFREEGEEFPITVRMRPEDRLTTQDLNNISLRTPSGEMIPLSSVVEQKRGRGPSGISRINSQRVTNISANLESGVALGEAVDRIRADLSRMNLPEGFSITYGGEYREQQRAAADFRMAVIVAIILIYMVLAGQFERFFDPLIVMLSIPLTVIGIIPTLLLTGTTVNIQSLMGMIMLIGIVVNNAIVLVDYINLLRREQNMTIQEAVIEAGRLRLRPILMTTLTTILGLLPLSFAWGAGAEIQAALARVVIGGLTVSTLITLVIIPVFYLSVYQLMARIQSWKWLPGFMMPTTQQAELN